VNKDEMTIVTGGGRGIGRAIALRMARETAVTVVGRTQSDLISVCHEVEMAGGSALFCTGDVTDPATADLASLAWSSHRVRNLVLNAGIGKSALPHEYDTALFQSIMDVNVMGAFHFIKAFVPKMIENGGGNIILMSSVSGLVGSKRNAPYTASKHALVGFAKGMAQDYGAQGIVTVAICPGYVETAMTERSIQKRVELHGISREEARTKIERINPQHRLIQPEEVAEMIAFVCSGLVPSLSGSAIVLSGGA
jgi:NAD(P)-dependent dehydrogenase (short-subunit alcohol dehydrogenase family)